MSKEGCSIESEIIFFSIPGNTESGKKIHPRKAVSETSIVCKLCVKKVTAVHDLRAWNSPVQNYGRWSTRTKVCQSTLLQTEKTAYEGFEILKTIYGDATPSWATVYRWYTAWWYTAF